MIFQASDTTLMVASQNGYDRVVQVLLQAKANLNAGQIMATHPSSLHSGREISGQ
jgi:hypothetical protein